MNQDFEKNDMVDDELHDEWLQQQLRTVQLEPPVDFTTKVVEQVEIKPNLLSNSPFFWMIVSVPLALIVWFLLQIISDFSNEFQLSFRIIPDIGQIISFYQLSKYVLMIIFGGLLFFGFDLLLSKQFTQKEKFFYSFFV